jgi:hypothetical protein
MSARTFKATRVTPTPVHDELLGDKVAQIIKPVARMLRWPVDCPGCKHRQQWLNRVHREIKDWIRKEL